MQRIKISPPCTDRSHHVHIDFDVFKKLPALLKKEKFGSKYLLITDTNIKKFYGDALLKTLKKANIPVEMVVVAAGEKSKNWENVSKIAVKMLQKKYDRGSCIIALGGGVIGDLSGFIAQMYKRGISYIQIPTSLMAMVDSAIGGKVGIDTKEGKNLLGGFHQPKAIFIDLNFLKKLPLRQLQTGLAEVIKYSVVGNLKLFKYLEKNSKKILSRNKKALEYIIKESIKLKASKVSQDERDMGVRKMLNYGHTFGHAIEAVAKYKLTHGEAVSIGMNYANIIAQQYCDFEETDRINALLEAYGLPIEAPKKFLQAKELLYYMAHDKKAIDGHIYFVLPKTIGNVIITEVEKSDLRTTMKKIALDS